MSNLLIGLLGALLATNQTVAVTNFVAKKTGVTIPLADPNDPVEQAYSKLLEDDDAAQVEVDKWIRENEKFAEKGAGGVADAALQLRIEQRFEPVHKAYQEFLERHPKHARARLAYGSFLNDIGKEADAKGHWEKALELDPKNPAAWNNLANYYGHRGPITNAFVNYQKAIELNPNEPVYYQNFATTVYLFRRDAMEFFKIDEPRVFDRALELYRQALKLDPANLALATDYAQSYYGIKPLRYDEAMSAWGEALKIANDDVTREGIYLHFARLQLNTGRFNEARTNLNLVTNEQFKVLKDRLARNLVEKEKKTNEVNSTAEAKK
ncbi:MAG: tetratricopeptide repeat protein [Verrucomicrobia bacterium]|nr:tetratricopeptide repeat protein [Verrucomicrobiota bacterium]